MWSFKTIFLTIQNLKFFNIIIGQYVDQVDVYLQSLSLNYFPVLLTQRLGVASVLCMDHKDKNTFWNAEFTATLLTSYMLWSRRCLQPTFVKSSTMFFFSNLSLHVPPWLLPPPTTFPFQKLQLLLKKISLNNWSYLVSM